MYTAMCLKSFLSSRSALELRFVRNSQNQRVVIQRSALIDQHSISVVMACSIGIRPCKYLQSSALQGFSSIWRKSHICHWRSQARSQACCLCAAFLLCPPGDWHLNVCVAVRFLGCNASLLTGQHMQMPECLQQLRLANCSTSISDPLS